MHLWGPPTVQRALPNRRSKRQLRRPLGSAPCSGKSIKTWLPGTAVTVTITPMRQQRVHLPSDHQPDSSEPTPPVLADSHEPCRLHRPSSLDQLRHSSSHHQGITEKLGRSATVKYTGIWLYKWLFSGPTVPRRLPCSPPPSCLPSCVFN
jgi:hypothetical protein